MSVNKNTNNLSEFLKAATNQIDQMIEKNEVESATRPLWDNYASLMRLGFSKEQAFEIILTVLKK